MFRLVRHYAHVYTGRTILWYESYRIIPVVRSLVNDQLIRKYCSRFVARLQKWSHYFDRTHDLLFCMIYYHEIWEAFPEDEPWHNSAGKPITYFLDINYERRLREMDALFDA